MTEAKEARSQEGLGQLAHELSVLVRFDLELAAAKKLPAIRRASIDFVLTLGGAIAVLLALIALTWAEGLALMLIIPGWAAALVVAGGWAALAGTLLLLEHPRRLATRLHSSVHQDLIETKTRQRDQAEQAVRRTAEGIASEMAREAAAHEGKKALAALEHELGDAEYGRLAEVVRALTAPGRAGIELVERLAGLGVPAPKAASSAPARPKKT